MNTDPNPEVRTGQITLVLLFIGFIFSAITAFVLANIFCGFVGLVFFILMILQDKKINKIKQEDGYKRKQN